MKIKPINIEKTQNDHPHRVLSTTLVNTHNIPCHPSLSVPFVYKVSPQHHHSLTKDIRSSTVIHTTIRSPKNNIHSTDNKSVNATKMNSHHQSSTQSSLNQRTNDDLEKNKPQQNNLLTRTDDQAKRLREHNQETSSIIKTYSLVKTDGIQPQAIGSWSNVTDYKGLNYRKLNKNEKKHYFKHICCRCSLVCLIVSLIAFILLGTAISAMLVVLLPTPKSTTTTSTTMTTTTVTTATATATATATSTPTSTTATISTKTTTITATTTSTSTTATTTSTSITTTATTTMTTSTSTTVTTTSTSVTTTTTTTTTSTSTTATTTSTSVTTTMCNIFGFEQPPMLYTTGQGPQSVVSADFNKDGHSDLAITNYNGNTLSIFLGIGNGSFQSPSMNFASSGSNPYWLVAQDLNNDGNFDLAICNEGSNTISVLLGLGNGSFQSSANNFSSGGSSPSAITAADLNNDNQTDLVVTNTGSNNITVFIAIGNGTFQVPGKSYAAGSLPSSITNGDFNGDGDIDLAVVSRNSNQLLIFLGLGNGTFLSNITSYTTGSFPYAVRTADFNGDLKLDLVVANFVSNSISIFMGTGTGAFVLVSPSTYATTGAGPIDIATHDLNGDSVIDLAVSNQVGNNINVYLGNGNGTFGQAQNYSSAGQKLQSIIAQDFNEDGMYDLAVTNQNSNTVSVLLTKCT